jgi:hypothetical protein
VIDPSGAGRVGQSGGVELLLGVACLVNLRCISTALSRCSED